MKPGLSYYFGVLSLICCTLSCRNRTQNAQAPPPTEQQVKQELITSHQMYIKQEDDEINQYIKRHKYVMQTTRTGIHYMFYKHGNGDQPEVGDYATVSYKVSLLDGTVCYDSKSEGPKQFKVGQDAVESGVHQAVEMMHVGDEGLFIIPSYLAHGLVGDRERIPPGAVVVYDINLLSVKKAKTEKPSSK